MFFDIVNRAHFLAYYLGEVICVSDIERMSRAVELVGDDSYGPNIVIKANGAFFHHVWAEIGRTTPQLAPPSDVGTRSVLAVEDAVEIANLRKALSLCTYLRD